MSRESRQRWRRLKKGYLREGNQLVKGPGGSVGLVYGNGLTSIVRRIGRFARFGALSLQQS